MLPSMPARILTLLLLLSPAWAFPAQARVLEARIAKVSTAVATLHEVRVRLAWPADAASGELELRARRVLAPELGYGFEDVLWRCPLQRGWRCDGTVRSGNRAPLRLSLDLTGARTDAVLATADASLSLHRDVASPDLTRLDLIRVPAAWAQALLAQAWPDANLSGGRLDGRLSIEVPPAGPMRVQGRLTLAGLGLDTPDGLIAAEGVGADLDLDYRVLPRQSLVTVDARLRGGEFLFGNAYVSLPQTPVQLGVAACRHEGRWELPQLLWDDPGALRVEGTLSLDADAGVDAAELDIASPDLAPLVPRYLSGWLGVFGLADLELAGSMQARLSVQDGELARAQASLREMSIGDAKNRFRFDGIEGDPVFSAAAPAGSVLRWRGGQVMGLEFGAASWPLRSGEGRIALERDIEVPLLGGAVRFEGASLRPPAGDRGLEVELGLTLRDLDVARLAQAMQWPAFKGQLDGHIPRVRYANDRIDLDGTLSAAMFDGSVQVSGLAMERPFGTAPTLAADIVFDDLNLQSLTEVFGFGAITGALDGSIRGLRLVDWSAQAFHADLHTDPGWPGEQRISQRAVQDLSSVGGGGGLGESLQAQALKLFEDFRYRQIGIRCRLANGVCRMDGLGSVGNGFSIVQGAGLPRLSVVGFNRNVDWPTLVDRLVAVTQGQSTPVIE
jgi:hypothetical protein